MFSYLAAIIVPVYTNHGNGQPLTDEARNTMLGVFVFLNLLWIFYVLKDFITHYIYNRKHDKKSIYYRYSIEWSGLTGILTLFNGIVWGFVVLITIGYFIGLLF